jgi:type I restriction enzyme S subunit
LNDSYWGGSIPWISAATLKRSRIDDSDQYLTEAGVRSGSKMASPGAILILVRGMALHRETRIGMATRPVSFNQDIKALIPRPGLLPAFLLYSLQAQSMQILDLVSSAGSGTGVLNTQLLQRLKIWIPDEKAQRRIVVAIETADSYVTTLKRLIAKKRAIERGMMQQLLTGRVRLPGFTEPWRGVCLRDAGLTYGGLTGKKKEDFGAGSALFVTFTEVMARPRLLGQRLEHVKMRLKERQNQIQRGDVLFNGSSETPEEVALAAVVDFEPSTTTFLNSFCFGYRLKRGDLIDPAYLAFFFRSDAGRVLVASLAQGATRYNIAKTKFLDLCPVLPSVDEQRAIVAILRDCGGEIEAIEQRLAKARAIKQGMMQELFPGRARPAVQERSTA